MIGVLTGDIINSKKKNPDIWLNLLKEALRRWGKSPKQWEIYRGDSFQLEIKNVKYALVAAIQIKAAIKSMKGLDVRIAIGLGDKTFSADKVNESNGSAFVNSGEQFEILKKNKINLAVKSNDERLNDEMNLYLKLALLFMDRWSETAAETVNISLQNPDKTQKELSKLIGGIEQNTVSTRLKRAHYDEILELIRIYRLKIGELK